MASFVMPFFTGMHAHLYGGAHMNLQPAIILLLKIAEVQIQLVCL